MAPNEAPRVRPPWPFPPPSGGGHNNNNNNNFTVLAEVTAVNFPRVEGGGWSPSEVPRVRRPAPPPPVAPDTVTDAFHTYPVDQLRSYVTATRRDVRTKKVPPTPPHPPWVDTDGAQGPLPLVPFYN